MAPRIKKDKDLKQYELLEYFEGIARQSDIAIAGDIILHRIAEGCPGQYMEDIEGYMCGKLITLLESCLDALQSVSDDRATPFQVRAALSHIGRYLADISDPKLREWEELINGKQTKR